MHAYTNYMEVLLYINMHTHAYTCTYIQNSFHKYICIQMCIYKTYIKYMEQYEIVIYMENILFIGIPTPN
jgi:hypothetical protein